MKILTDFKTFYSGFGKKQPLEQIIAEATEAAILSIQECDYTILREQYIRHMALAKIAAMEAWNHGGLA